jgi:opacity protein-like surface antigen
MIEGKKSTLAIGALGLAASLMTAGIASAQTKAPGSLYAGVQYAAMMIEDEGEELDLGVFIGRFGYVLTDYMSIEARLGFGVSDDSQTVVFEGVPFRATYSFKELAGIYGRFTLPLDPLTLYTVGGVTTATVELSIESVPPFLPFQVTESNRETSGSLGVGMEYRFTEQVSVDIEYMRYFSDADALSVGLKLNF